MMLVNKKNVHFNDNKTHVCIIAVSDDYVYTVSTSLTDDKLLPSFGKFI